MTGPGEHYSLKHTRLHSQLQTREVPRHNRGALQCGANLRISQTTALGHMSPCRLESGPYCCADRDALRVSGRRLRSAPAAWQGRAGRLCICALAGCVHARGCILQKPAKRQPSEHGRKAQRSFQCLGCGARPSSIQPKQSTLQLLPVARLDCSTSVTASGQLCTLAGVAQTVAGHRAVAGQPEGGQTG